MTRDEMSDLMEKVRRWNERARVQRADASVESDKYAKGLSMGMALGYETAASNLSIWLEVLVKHFDGFEDLQREVR